MWCTPRSWIFRTFWSNISAKSKPNSKILQPVSEAYMCSNHEKKWRSKISWHTPFKQENSVCSLSLWGKVWRENKFGNFQWKLFYPLCDILAFQEFDKILFYPFFPGEKSFNLKQVQYKGHMCGALGSASEAEFVKSKSSLFVFHTELEKG